MDPQLISISGSNNNNNNNTSTSTSDNNNYENNCVEENNGLQWTNEKHSNFLRLMEASFVRNFLERSSNNITKVTHHVTSRLDRFVPDISESTLDLHKSGNFSYFMKYYLIFVFMILIIIFICLYSLRFKI